METMQDTEGGKKKSVLSWERIKAGFPENGRKRWKLGKLNNKNNNKNKIFNRSIRK